MIAVSTAAQWLALSGLFVSRAFLPLAGLVVMCRLIGDGTLDPALFALPGTPRAWFVADDFAMAVVALALVEWAMNHLRTTQRALRRFDVYYKPFLAAYAFSGLGFSGDGTLLRQVGADAWLSWLRLDLEPNVPLAITFLTTLVLALYRKSALRRLAAQDLPDNLGMQRATAWAEDLWTLLFVPAFVLSPPVALAGVLLATLALGKVRGALRIHEESDKVICVCGQLNYRSAVRCAGCGGRNDAPARIGFFGQATAAVERDPLHQGLSLFEVKRCPRCASHLVGAGPRQFCGACGASAANDPTFFDSYDLRVRTRTTSALLLSALLGAVPVVGTILAIFHARRQLIAPYTRFAHPGWFARGLLAIAWLVIAALTLVPGVGLLAMPLMAFTAHRVHRAAFRRAARSDDEEDDAYGAWSTSH